MQVTLGCRRKCQAPNIDDNKMKSSNIKPFKLFLLLVLGRVRLLIARRRRTPSPHRNPLIEPDISATDAIWGFFEARPKIRQEQREQNS